MTMPYAFPLLYSPARITLIVRGQHCVLLAKPRAAQRALPYAIAGGVADILKKPRFEMGVDPGRGINVAGAAHSFNLGGGPVKPRPNEARHRAPVAPRPRMPQQCS